jgi:hypothetical protein
MPPEYDEWVNDNYHDMLKFALSRGSSAEAVDDAVLRTIQSEAFPVNDMTLWWTWHCGAIRSYISHQARGGARAADLAQEVAGAISSERGTRQYIYRGISTNDAPEAARPAPLIYFHTEEDKPEGHPPVLALGQFKGIYHVREIARCTHCGLPVRWEMEREPYDDVLDGHPTYIPVAACFGCGRRQYNRAPGNDAPLFGGLL